MKNLNWQKYSDFVQTYNDICERAYAITTKLTGYSQANMGDACFEDIHEITVDLYRNLEFQESVSFPSEWLLLDNAALETAIRLHKQNQ